MGESFFSKIFPLPEYLTRPAAGLDVSDQFIRFVHLTPGSGGLDVSAFGEVSIASGAIEKGTIKDAGAVRAALVDLRKRYQLQTVIGSLPEEHCHVTNLAILPTRPENLEAEIVRGLNGSLSLPAKDTVFDYRVLRGPRRGHNFYEVAVVATSRTVARMYADTIRSAGVELVGLEPEVNAFARALSPVHSDRVSLIVHVGATRAIFAVVDSGTVVFSTTTHTISGHVMTALIAKTLDIPPTEAKRLKTTQGLLRSRAEPRLFGVLVPHVSVLRDEIERRCRLWNTRPEIEVSPERAIHSVILCGTEASLPGLVDYLANSLTTPVTLGNVWRNVASARTTIPPINHQDSVRYTTAIGLALPGAILYA